MNLHETFEQKEKTIEVPASEEESIKIPLTHFDRKNESVINPETLAMLKNR